MLLSSKASTGRNCRNHTPGNVTWVLTSPEGVFSRKLVRAAHGAQKPAQTHLLLPTQGSCFGRCTTRDP